MPKARPPRIVIDTNVYVSRLLGSASIPAQAVMKAERIGEILTTEAIRVELYEVLYRPKLARFIQPGLRRAFLDHFEQTTTMIEVPSPIRACRDPKDDKFLEAAVAGRADTILTGDEDLLALGPFRGVQILSPAQFLAQDNEEAAPDIL
jgi:putative PIN family toxin of toxin-antitoxin system